MAASLAQNWLAQAAQKIHPISVNFEQNIGKGQYFVFTLPPWTTIKELKQSILKKVAIPVSMQRLFHRNIELMNHKTLDESVLLECKITLRMNVTREGKYSWIDVYGSLHCPSKMVSLLSQIKKAFNSGYAPQLTINGTAGTYELKDIFKKIKGIFKPIDEEAFAPNNPRGYTSSFGSEGFRRGVLSGEACIREVAAYLIDKSTTPRTLRCVPPTVFVQSANPSYCYQDAQGLFAFDNHRQENLEMMNMINPINSKFGNDGGLSSTTATTQEQDSLQSSKEYYYQKLKQAIQYPPKYGSLQMFIKSDDVAQNLSPSLFIKKHSNKDHYTDGNKKKKMKSSTHVTSSKYFYELIPIDHGLSFPDTLQISSFDLCWADWPQAFQPFSCKMLQFIDKIDPVKDLKRLNGMFKFRPICLRNARISVTLLKKAAKMGFNLNDITSVLCRQDLDESPSILEEIVENARSICDMAMKVRKYNPIQYSPQTSKYQKEIQQSKKKQVAKENPPPMKRQRSNSECAQSDTGNYFNNTLIIQPSNLSNENQLFIQQFKYQQGKKQNVELRKTIKQAESIEEQLDSQSQQKQQQQLQQENIQQLQQAKSKASQKAMLKKNNSQPELSLQSKQTADSSLNVQFFSDSLSQEEQDVKKEQNGKEQQYARKKLKRQNYKKKRNNSLLLNRSSYPIRNSAFDQQFFHYLDSFLEQKLNKLLKKKQKSQTQNLQIVTSGLSPNTMRQRSMSTMLDSDDVLVI